MAANRQVDYRRRIIDAAFERARTISGIPNVEAVQADYARYLCVLVSGFVEKAAAELILEYSQDKAARQIQSFLDSNLRRLTNVDTDRLLKIMGSLDAIWEEKLNQFMDDKRQQALNSIVGLRHDIAHGGGGGISLNQVQQYWETIREIIDYIDSLLFANPRVVNAKKVKVVR